MNSPLRYIDPTGHYGVSDWWRDTSQGAGIVRGWASSAGQSIANTIKKPFVVPNVAPDPNSYQSLMVQNGTPLFPDMTGANNPAIAVVKAGSGALLQAGMMIGPGGEEKTLLSAGEEAMRMGKLLKAGWFTKVGTEAIQLGENRAVSGLIKDGKVIGIGDPLLGHGELAKKLGIELVNGKLPQGMEGFLAQKTAGKVGIVGAGINGTGEELVISEAGKKVAESFFK